MKMLSFKLMNFGTLLKRELFLGRVMACTSYLHGPRPRRFHDLHFSKTFFFFFFLQADHNDLLTVSYLYLNDTRCSACSVSANRIKKIIMKKTYERITNMFYNKIIVVMNSKFNI